MKRVFASEIPMPDVPTTGQPYSRIWRPDKRYVHAAPHPEDVGGVLSKQFDRGVALTGYGLLAFSIFSLGLPAVATLALARAHSRGAHPITLSHYRFQERLFWFGAAALLLGALTGFMAAAFALSDVWSWLAAHWSWLDRTVGAWAPADDRAQIAGWLVVATVVLVGYGVAQTLIGAAWGAIKLVAGRPIGHIGA